MTPSLFGRRKAHPGALFSAWILAWLLAAPAFAGKAAPAVGVVPAGNFAADGMTARERRIPILLFYTRDGCSWCEMVRVRHLQPLLREPQAANRVLIREVRLDEGADIALTDFDGRATTHAAFARNRRIRLSPTLDFLDDKGQRLVEPIVGVLLPDFYGAFIDRAIDDSLAKLRPETK